MNAILRREDGNTPGRHSYLDAEGRIMSHPAYYFASMGHLYSRQPYPPQNGIILGVAGDRDPVYIRRDGSATAIIGQMSDIALEGIMSVELERVSKLDNHSIVIISPEPEKWTLMRHQRCPTPDRVQIINMQQHAVKQKVLSNLRSIHSFSTPDTKTDLRVTIVLDQIDVLTNQHEELRHVLTGWQKNRHSSVCVLASSNTHIEELNHPVFAQITHFGDPMLYAIVMEDWNSDVGTMLHLVRMFGQ